MRKEVHSIAKEDLVDIRDVKINMDLPKEERILDFLEQIKNPYLYRYGDMVIVSSFAETETSLTKRLEQQMRYSL